MLEKIGMLNCRNNGSLEKWNDGKPPKELS
jgi:hypothetical protein